MPSWQEIGDTVVIQSVESSRKNKGSDTSIVHIQNNFSKAVPVEWFFCMLTDTDWKDRFFQDVNEYDLLWLFYNFRYKV